MLRFLRYAYWNWSATAWLTLLMFLVAAVSLTALVLEVSR